MTLELLSYVQISLISWDAPVEFPMCIQTQHIQPEPIISPSLPLSSLPLFYFGDLHSHLTSSPNWSPPTSYTARSCSIFIRLVTLPFSPFHQLLPPCLNYHGGLLAGLPASHLFSRQANCHEAAEISFLKWKLDFITPLLLKAFKKKLRISS